ncbi:MULTISPECIES: SPOR domain-containing protein [Rhodanobacter]|uniref:SPOR domain-containing protein n=1 Tax=Rhodanobacter TaxID=75309 RepID=UPI0003FEEC7C|nr:MULTISPECIES: SPOR domain-containing protein [Rhodanobacter]TAN18984.1 MAG: SPOR domain-containing protein [Rhodanobacter sp.]UJJ56430.1 SPOR domain-containing protein [Rhodanobacter thiooxydans]
MKTRLLGAAVLIALAVLFVPMFFSSTPPAPGGDQAVSLAIPPAPDRDLQTRTMSLAAGAASAASAPSPSAPPASSDRLATVNIGSSRPRDVETDPEAGKPPQPTTVTIGSGTSPSQPVIPQQTTPSPTRANTATAPAKKPQTVAVVPPSRPVAAAPMAAAPALAAARGNYTLNLSAYASAAGAASLERRVRALGYPVSGHAITQAGQPRTLVTAGPFETRAAAEAARLKITQSIPGVPARLEQDASRESAAAAPATAATGTAKAGGWAVQLAAMSDQADANALRDKLRANGFDGFVDSVQSGGRRLWRVRAGPQTQRADAQRVHDQIKAKLGIDGNVVPVP